jgi:hypothetical protein
VKLTFLHEGVTIVLIRIMISVCAAVWTVMLMGGSEAGNDVACDVYTAGVKMIIMEDFNTLAVSDSSSLQVSAEYDSIGANSCVDEFDKEVMFKLERIWKLIPLSQHRSHPKNLLQCLVRLHPCRRRRHSMKLLQCLALLQVTRQFRSRRPCRL